MVLVCVLLVAGLVLWPTLSRAQRGPAAEINSTSALPVYVVNEASPSLPDGFVPHSSWRFTTLTVPNVLSWSATVERTYGGWAYLHVTTAEGTTGAGWYYVPYMQGRWEKQ